MNPIDTASASIVDAFAEWARCTTVSPGTVRAYCRTGRTLARHGLVELEQLDRETFCRFQDARLAEGRSAATINNDLNALKVLLAWLVRREGEASRAAELLAELSRPGTRLRRRVPEARDHYPRELYQELLPVAREIAGWFGSVALPLACFTGVRRNELRRADREDFDLEARLFYVRRKTRALGAAGETKNRQERAVSLCSDAIAIIREHAPSSGPLFPAMSSRARTPYMSEDMFKRAMRELARRTAVRCTWHRCRRTFATWAILRDVPIAEVSRALGHQDVRVTQQAYIHWLQRYVPAFERLSFAS